MSREWWARAFMTAALAMKSSLVGWWWISMMTSRSNTFGHNGNNYPRQQKKIIRINSVKYFESSLN
jgi:hypothetical protein